MKKKLLIALTLILSVSLIAFSLTACKHKHSFGEDNYCKCGEPNYICAFTYEGNKITGLTEFGKTLTTIKIPSSHNGEELTTIKKFAFAESSNLENVIIERGITRIEKYAFFATPNMATIDIPNTVTYFGEYAFFACGLTSIKIPESVETIEYAAFSGNSYIKSINVDENNKNYTSIDGDLYTKDGKTLIQYAIGKDASTYEIPDNVQYIGQYAFSSCDKLTYVKVPQGVTSIGNGAFCNCTSLKTIIIGPDVVYVGEDVFYNCTSLVNVSIGYNVTRIGRAAFFNCTSLYDITLPTGLKSLGDAAFSGCIGLTKIIIPSNVTYVGSIAFLNCNKLEIKCRAKSQPGGWASDWNKSNCSVKWGYTGY